MLKNLLLSMILPVALALPLSVSAQEAVPEHPGVSADMQTFVLRERLDADGLPVLDDQGKPVIDTVPVAEESVVPGDEISYVITVKNLGEAIEGMDMSFDVSPELSLITGSVTSSIHAEFGFSTGDDIGTVLPLLADGEGNPSDEFSAVGPDEVIRLHAAIPAVAEGETFTLSYNLNVR